MDIYDFSQDSDDILLIEFSLKRTLKATCSLACLWLIHQNTAAVNL